MNVKWWKTAVVYQIYPRSFMDSDNDGVGDIRGILEKLPYLSNLGINVIWLSPVYKSPMKDNGYDISDYQDIDPIFGNLKDLEELIKLGKTYKIKILMDLVVNHTSDKHKWFQESRKTKNNPYRDYYIWRDEPSDMGSTFGGSAWTFDEATKQYYFHNFAKEQPDLNWENPKVREEIHSMINWWLDKGIGGFRLDVIDLIGKEIDKNIVSNGPNLHPFIQDMNRETFGNYNVMTVGETWGATPEIGELYSDPKRKELSMIFQFEHMTLDWDWLGKWIPKELNLKQLKEVLSKWQTGVKKGWNSLFWNNHDLPRIVSRWGNDKEYRVESAKMLAMTLHIMKGTPYIFQGEEIGMTNVKFDSLEDYNDVEIHGSYKDFVVNQKLITHDQFMNGVYAMGRDNARTPMQWNNQENAGFSDETPWLKVNPNYKNINVIAALKDTNSIFYTYKDLIEMRRKSDYSELISSGDFELLFKDSNEIFAYRRFNDFQEIVVISNFTDKELDFEYDYKGYDIVMENYQASSLKKLLPYESLILYKEKKL
ncbi:Oligo-1,6-glucosidase [Candidatus Izimaplasma bacterium HR1]|jgi:glycosidase|uniref:alpha-glucosidase n=1 Tax=Candidatus Izimoplasma sp. HR1 TaxID=1541959 RepID=UPI0004F8B6BC|nr:Oligo-1,6-glucosidase [Candidatus Izimaplasma bacterium HR1]